MKIKNISAICIVLVAVTLCTTNMTAKTINLPAPEFKGGMPVNEVVANRHSTREFDADKELDAATLGQLLWMTLGVNRPQNTTPVYGAPPNRSNPTALNWQEVHAYVFGKDGVWEYLPATHSLRRAVEGDHRLLLAGTPEFSQDFVKDAPYTILFVADVTNLPDAPLTKTAAAVDTGIACENLCLACASLGIATVPRATMDTAAISKLLSLTPTQLPLINNPVGYPK